MKNRYILGIETSCDETAAAVFDTTQSQIISSHLFSQIKEHEAYGGVVPEIASRSQLEKIDVIVQHALNAASVSLADIGTIAVTTKPGLAGSLLVGLAFAKALAWAAQKKIIGINHLEGHAFSAFLLPDGRVNEQISFPHLCLSVSGGHTTLYLVRGFGDYEALGQTIDDAAGEAFDKIAKMLGFGYPGGAIIERLARENNFQDIYHYPRTKNLNQDIFFSFSGLKTAVLYSLVKQGVYNLKTGPIYEKLSDHIKKDVSSSLLVCITDIFENNIRMAFKKHPNITGLTFVGGVACNKYMKERFSNLCSKLGKSFFAAAPQFCTDNGAMIAFVGSYKAAQGLYADLHLDVL
jgi:N6-L-threonylcarbamoyladenine synthase